jgi:hypothetical protein
MIHHRYIPQINAVPHQHYFGESNKLRKLVMYNNLCVCYKEQEPEKHIAPQVLFTFTDRMADKAAKVSVTDST